MIAATGFRPDLRMLGELRLDLDDRVEATRALAPLIDPNLHSCGSVPPHGVDELSHPDAGIYMVGMKSYGRAPTFLLRTGYEQVRSVAAALAGDWESARQVDFVLPETGVCNGPAAPAETAPATVRPRAAAAARRTRSWSRSTRWREPRRRHHRRRRGAPPLRDRLRTRRWGIVGALSITETVSYGILYYAFAAFLVPMQRDLGFSAAQLTGAFSLSLLVAAGVGIVVGRHLDRHAPRAVMTGGSVAGALLVLAWSQVESLAAFYAIWVAIGVVMAMVLYEVAFTVLAKAFPEPGERRRAMTAMTLVAALASFIFLPLSQALIDAYGWRDALVVLAVILGVTTVPLHAIALRVRRARATPRRPRRRRPCPPARRCARGPSGCSRPRSSSPRSPRSR